MKHEAKFSVILPAGNYASAQIETFEQLAIRYNLPVKLPLNADRAGNLIVASALSLRDAQLLRRQVAGLGFPADCVSDASESQLLGPKDGSIDTLVVGALGVPDPSTDSIGDLTSDAWSSLEMPSSLDLGLSDAADVSGVGRWNESNWLEPDDSAIPEETPTKESTLGMSAMDLFAAAQSANRMSNSNQSLNAVNILGNKKPAIVHSAMQAPKPGMPQFNASSDSKRSTGLHASQQIGSTAEVKAQGIAAQQQATLDNKVLSDAQQKNAAADQASVLPVVPQQTPAAQADSAKTAAITAPQNLIVSTENKTTAIQAPQTNTSAEASNPAAEETTSSENKKEEASEQTKSNAPTEHREKAKIPASVILAWILIFIVTICLVIAVFYAYIEPKEMLTPLLNPLF
ncbi:MAG: hypothetical protein J6A01_10345 [Proteobacteria bacterium]|nr:hypothetical protein [Pseudomonadota bacterium]